MKTTKKESDKKKTAVKDKSDKKETKPVKKIPKKPVEKNVNDLIQDSIVRQKIIARSTKIRGRAMMKAINAERKKVVELKRKAK